MNRRLQNLLVVSNILLIGIVVYFVAATNPFPGGSTALSSSAQAEASQAGAFVAKSPVSEVAHRVSPAVVTVGAVAVKRQLVRDPFYWEFFNSYTVRDVRERIPYIGSGSLVDREGHIVTNYHVVENGESFFVTFSNGEEYPAELIDADPYIDIAVLKVDVPEEELPEPIEFGDSEALQIGETLIALGNPFGPMIADPRPSVTTGVVSALHRTFKPDPKTQKVYQDMIQTDAAINPGNSGGPIVDAFGRMVGVNTFIFSASGGSLGIGFAIPVNRVRRILEEIREYGHVRQLWLDFAFTNVRSQSFRGVLVQYVAEGGPAEEAGLESGDIILYADGRRIYSAAELELYFLGKQVGESLNLDIIREGEEKKLEYIVAAPEEE